MKVDLPGIHKVKRRLADGTVREHYYAYRGGPPIHEPPNTAAFVLAYEAAVKARKDREEKEVRERRKAGAKTFQRVLDRFQRTEEWGRLKPRSQSDYAIKVAIIGKAFGTLPLDAFSDTNQKRTKGIMKEWRSKLPGKSRRHADYTWSVLARVCSVAVEYGWIENNPCTRGGRFYESDRREFIWSEQDITRLLPKLPAHLHLPVRMALYTGQRPGDLIRMRFGKSAPGVPYYENGHLHLRQRKTGALVKLRAISPLREILDAEAAKRPGDFILLTTKGGKPWTSAGFSSLFTKLKNAAGFRNLRFYDLRGTAATNLAVAGASNQQIAAITGHSVNRVESILEANYIGGRAELAEHAVRKLEAAERQKAA